ncbi:hypothetical protein [Haloferax larsenii]|nr:hypothetical protein [Haloferax larsenii]
MVILILSVIGTPAMAQETTQTATETPVTTQTSETQTQTPEQAQEEQNPKFNEILGSKGAVTVNAIEWNETSAKVYISVSREMEVNIIEPEPDGGGTYNFYELEQGEHIINYQFNYPSETDKLAIAGRTGYEIYKSPNAPIISFDRGAIYSDLWIAGIGVFLSFTAMGVYRWLVLVAREDDSIQKVI